VVLAPQGLVEEVVAEESPLKGWKEAVVAEESPLVLALEQVLVQVRAPVLSQVVAGLKDACAHSCGCGRRMQAPARAKVAAVVYLSQQCVGSVEAVPGSQAAAQGN
jgi:hypothetical protein